MAEALDPSCSDRAARCRHRHLPSPHGRPTGTKRQHHTSETRHRQEQGGSQGPEIPGKLPLWEAFDSNIKALAQISGDKTRQDR
jgi:hypothetical protein